MRNGKMTIYNAGERRCIVTLDDGTDLTVNACCTGVSWSKSNNKAKAVIEYEPIELEIKNITSEDFYTMLEKLNNNQADDELEEFDKYDVRSILFGKMQEMSEYDKSDFEDEGYYNACCSVMNDIAVTLLKSLNEQEL